MLVDVVPTLLTALVTLTDQAPEPEDVKAGWTAFGLFIGGLVAVGLLGWSLVRQLRKVEDARKRGVYGDEPEVDGAEAADPSDAAPTDAAPTEDQQR